MRARRVQIKKMDFDNECGQAHWAWRECDGRERGNTVRLKKTGHLTFDRNFGKCRPIFKILSPLDPEEILCTVYKYVCYAAFWNLKIKIAIDFSGISRERIYYSDSGRLLCFDIDIADIECLRDVAMPTNIGTTLAANGLCRQITTWGFRIKDGLFSINPYTSVSRSV